EQTVDGLAQDLRRNDIGVQLLALLDEGQSLALDRRCSFRTCDAGHTGARTREWNGKGGADGTRPEHGNCVRHRAVSKNQRPASHGSPSHDLVPGTVSEDARNCDDTRATKQATRATSRTTLRVAPAQTP